jgi:hypothetical protein
MRDSRRRRAEGVRLIFVTFLDYEQLTNIIDSIVLCHATSDKNQPAPFAPL